MERIRSDSDLGTLSLRARGRSSVKAAWLFGGMRRPLSFSFTIRWLSPTFVARTGQPQAMASKRTCGQPSVTEGRTKREAFL